MTTIEDILQFMHRSLPNIKPSRVDIWTQSFIKTTAQLVFQRYALTTEQARIILATANRLKNDLAGIMPDFPERLARLRANPEFRRPVVASRDIRREVRYLGEDFVGFRFKRDPHVARTIRQIASRAIWLISTADWKVYEPETAVWRVLITRSTLEPVMALIAEGRFQYDDTCLAYLTSASNALGQPIEAHHAADLGLIAVSVPDNPLATWMLGHVLDGRAV